MDGAVDMRLALACATVEAYHELGRIVFACRQLPLDD